MHDLIGLRLEEKSKGVNLWVEGSVKPFHNEVRVMPCALCVHAYESNAYRKVYYMFEQISQTKPLGGLQAATAEMTPQPNLKVVVMMSTCDCLPPPERSTPHHCDRW